MPKTRGITGTGGIVEIAKYLIFRPLVSRRHPLAGVQVPPFALHTLNDFAEFRGEQMAGITIVTGSPGAGKTTLSQRASKTSPRGLHIPADVFYTFPAHPISPILREAHEQNAAVIAAVSRAAAAFASRSYEVFLDGIFGPWFLPVMAAELGSSGIPVEYVVLQVSLEQAVRRATSRAQPGAEAMVRHMHAAFQDLNDYASHALDTTDLSTDETLAEFTRRRTLGVFALNLAQVPAAGYRSGSNLA